MARVAPFILVAVLPACGKSLPSPGQLSAEIDELTARRAEALQRHDRLAATEATLELDHRIELKAQLDGGDPDGDAVGRLERKYALLHRVAAEQDLRLRSDRTAAEAGPAVLPIAYEPRELEAVKAVMKDFGDLYVGEQASTQLRLDRIPWAGYWYPMSGSDLYNQPNAPLAKLDMLAAQLGKPSGTVDWEIKHPHPVASDWDGLCVGWAMAASTTPEPTHVLEYKGIQFTPADQKALLTKTHERFTSKMYGLRYQGDAHTDGTFQDLRPEAFQRIFLTMLGEQKRPFVIDDDPGPAVWSKPIFRVRWTVTKDPQHEDAFLVEALPWMIHERQVETNSPTSDADISAKDYTYRLWVDKQTQKDGKFLVIAGEWLGASFEDHPDYVLVPQPDGALSSSNDALNQALDVVQELFAKGTPR